MKWEGERQSDNVEDRRGDGGGFGGGMGGPRLGGRGIGLGAVVLALVAGWILGINPLTLLGLVEGGPGGAPATHQQPAKAPPSNDKAAAFASTVLASTEDVWGEQFRRGGGQYRPPGLVLFRGGTRTACGAGQSAMGPFYCPADQKVYIDLGFFDTLGRQLGAPGDFAQAYVIAHEVGHHVQRLLGVTEKVDSMRSRATEAQMNALSVRLELQADCLAGVWAHHSNKAKNWLEPGDVEEGLNAASRIGDDTLQRQSQGVVVPESFTHGTSAQRVNWFRKGLSSGMMASCNTFEVRQL
jgi:predicted metalloprotease